MDMVDSVLLAVANSNACLDHSMICDALSFFCFFFLFLFLFEQ